VSIKELAEYLGHRDASFTLRVYTHLMPGSHDRARRVIDAPMFRPRIQHAQRTTTIDRVGVVSASFRSPGSG